MRVSLLKRKLFIRLLLIVLSALSPNMLNIYAQAQSCLDDFSSFEPINPEIHPTQRNEAYGQVFSWYSDQCFLLGSTNGLWLYDVKQPENPVQLAIVQERAINHIAVNPSDFSIAFSVAQESTVYIIYSDRSHSTLHSNAEAITDLLFSEDGTLLAVSSSDFEPDCCYSNPEIQIWNLLDNRLLTQFTGEDAIVNFIEFGSSQNELVLSSMIPGYPGDNIVSWNLEDISVMWRYYDSSRNQSPRMCDDMFLPTSADMSGDFIAVGGLYRYMDSEEYYGNAIQLWDKEHQQCELEIIVDERGDGDGDIPLTDIAFNSDGSVLASSNRDGGIIFWNAIDGTRLTQFETFQDDTGSIQFSPRDSFLAVNSYYNGVTVWDVERMEKLVSLD